MVQTQICSAGADYKSAAGDYMNCIENCPVVATPLNSMNKSHTKKGKNQHFCLAHIIYGFKDIISH